MSTTRPKRPDPRTVRTRKAIETAAARLFSEQGIEPTTVDEIADAAGVSVGSLYFHYASKDGVLLALVARVLETADTYLQAARESDSALERLLRAGDVYFRFAIEQTVAFRYVNARMRSPRGAEVTGDALAAGAIQVPDASIAEQTAAPDATASADGAGKADPSAGAGKADAAAQADPIGGAEGPDAKVDAWVRDFIVTIGSDLQQAIDDGEIDRVPVDEAFAFVWGSWTGVADLVLREDAFAISPDLGERALKLGRSILVRGLGGSVPAPLQD